MNNRINNGNENTKELKVKSGKIRHTDNYKYLAIKYKQIPRSKQVFEET